MKRILFILLMFFITACSVQNTTYRGYNNEIQSSEVVFGRMANAFENYYNIMQFDSICISDHISNKLSDWELLPLRDFETNENVSQYIYIKSLGETESIYRLQIINDSIYKITKRITK